MTQYFDGKIYASEKTETLKMRVKRLKEQGVSPKLMSIIIGDDEGSILYQNLKKKAAENVGAELEISKLDKDINKDAVVDLIEEYNKDPKIHGIMIQLPLPKTFSVYESEELIDVINKEKDVDGLKEASAYVTPVVQAVVDAIPQGNLSSDITVLGAGGFEGKRIIKRLKELGYKNITGLGRNDKNVDEVLIKSDILVSATGQPDLVREKVVKEGVILIDVGSPKGDISKECYSKASYVSPVPGGIGPATIANLIENLVTAADNNVG